MELSEEEQSRLRQAMDYSALKAFSVCVDVILLHITYRKPMQEALEMIVRIKSDITKTINDREGFNDEVDKANVQEILDQIFRAYEKEREKPGDSET